MGCVDGQATRADRLLDALEMSTLALVRQPVWSRAAIPAAAATHVALALPRIDVVLCQATLASHAAVWSAVHAHLGSVRGAVLLQTAGHRGPRAAVGYAADGHATVGSLGVHVRSSTASTGAASSGTGSDVVDGAELEPAHVPCCNAAALVAAVSAWPVVASVQVAPSDMSLRLVPTAATEATSTATSTLVAVTGTLTAAVGRSKVVALDAGVGPVSDAVTAWLYPWLHELSPILYGNPNADAAALTRNAAMGLVPDARRTQQLRLLTAVLATISAVESARGRAVDPTFLTRPSNLWRMGRRRFQDDDSWKVVHHLRSCWAALAPAAQTAMLGHLDAIGAATVHAALERWHHSWITFGDSAAAAAATANPAYLGTVAAAGMAHLPTPDLTLMLPSLSREQSTMQGLVDAAATAATPGQVPSLQAPPPPMSGRIDPTVQLHTQAVNATVRADASEVGPVQLTRVTHRLQAWRPWDVGDLGRCAVLQRLYGVADAPVNIEGYAPEGGRPGALPVLHDDADEAPLTHPETWWEDVTAPRRRPLGDPSGGRGAYAHAITNAMKAYPNDATAPITEAAARFSSEGTCDSTSCSAPKSSTKIQ